MTAIIESPFTMFPHQSEGDEYSRYQEPAFTSASMEMSIPADALYGPRPGQQHTEVFPASTIGFEQSMYTDSSAPYMMSQHSSHSRASPGMYADDSDMRLGSSTLSTTSAPSAASSAIGSPQSHHGHNGSSMTEWGTVSMAGVQPAIVSNEYMASNGEYAAFGGHGMDDFVLDFSGGKTFVDPSLIHPEINRPPMTILHQHQYDAQFNHHQPTHAYPTSPSVAASPQINILRNGSVSPFLHSGPPHTAPFQPSVAPVTAFQHDHYASAMDPNARRQSLGGFISPSSADFGSGDESKEKQRCPHPDCGKVFKDLKAHMLTHQTERPEKCPIQTCEYHIKGFARKYDKNRHTLTHYKGNMVCGFCPGSGSAAEKSFNRADVFKRHLTAVHAVEQTPPNSRKKATSGMAAGKKLTGYAPDATGKCSTCSQTFPNAQDFYEHLDDCVLRIVQQEDPAEAINAQRLAEVEDDQEVHETLEKNNLPTTTQALSMDEDEDDDDDMDDDDADDSSKSTRSPTLKKKMNTAGGIQKSRGLTHSKGGVPTLQTKRGRKHRRDYPSSWGFDKGQMTMRKRVLCAFDGPRRLHKDEMMLSTEQEVRLQLSDPKAYITDLDVQTLRRAEAFHSATEEEKGPWISDDPTEEQRQEMHLLLAGVGQV
ncbi:hypothetical protein NLU13_1605 [Sarocladium strictum]|uniref:C2H2-type domain-containing protein n=1 Tax=Sarocladium strictum TaxID=5046 RepID=A0AA39GRA4_SARSR|nr:hypothetical protein NLU13_1605 [Sarocladium strictum]